MSKQESSHVDQLHEVLSTCLNPIMARGLIRSALSQVGMSEEELQRSGLAPSLKDALERGLNCDPH